MHDKYRILLAVVIVFLVWRTMYYFASLKDKQGSEQMESDLTFDSRTVKISLYYEALCPDSKFFVTQQLLPTFTELQDYVIIDFIPYGKAQTIDNGGKIEFQCQHFELECEANKIHACAIEHVKTPLLLVKYISCMISNNILPVDTAEQCAQELDIDFTPIAECSKGERGSELLKHYGERTHSLQPPMVFVPTIELNGSQNLVKQPTILKNLLGSVCLLLGHKPPQCV